MVTANDGVIITQTGNFIHCSNGDTYTLVGRILTGPRGTISMNVNSVSEAVGIVTGLHGGKRFGF